MKLKLLLAVVTISLIQTTNGQVQNAGSESRAGDIVNKLAIGDDQKRTRTHSILKEHLDSLHAIIKDRKKAMNDAATNAAGNKELAEARSKAAWDAAGGRLNKVHAAFLGKLSLTLTLDQTELLKDLMTEGGLQREYNHFLKLFPNLSELQKQQVITYLKEARENAMDAETVKDRRQWFIKYRGRANNYLSAAGYDLRNTSQ